MLGFGAEGLGFRVWVLGLGFRVVGFFFGKVWPRLGFGRFGQARGPVVSWSLVPWSVVSGPLVPRSSGLLVLWSRGPLVPWSSKPQAHMAHCDSPTVSALRHRPITDGRLRGIAVHFQVKTVEKLWS